MSLVRYFLAGAVVLFCVIGLMGWLKKGSVPKPAQVATLVQEVVIPAAPVVKKEAPPAPKKVVAPVVKKEIPVVESKPVPQKAADPLPEADRIRQLFATDSSKLPIVETVSYTSRVPWLSGRPAWIADYASHYETSRHFIARSLNKKVDYFTQKVGPGDKFNVFKKGQNIGFHLLIDLSRSKMWFYYVDFNAGERVLLKTYPVGLGRPDGQKKSGYLTPLGKYQLGEKIAIYKPGTMGIFQDEKVEMIRVFGTRWIPFDKELDGCSEDAKGFGIHGLPWGFDQGSSKWVENRAALGKYESDGCVRLAQEDIEEIFSIVITKPTTVELVKDFKEAKLPGVER